MKIYINLNHFVFSSELIILIGLLDKYPNETNHKNKSNISRFFPSLKWCKENIQYIDNIINSDICILPYKFKNCDDKYYKQLLNECVNYNKKLLCFYDDDDDTIFNLSDNVLLYRTSFYKTKKLKNEKALPVFSADYFNTEYLKNPELSIGFCGHSNCGRLYWQDILKNKHDDIKCNFILRNDFFWESDLNKKLSITEFYNNIKNNLFIFCYRGYGNYSYRFYQILMMGRIPILINTDCVFPFENKYKLKDLGVVINEKDLIDGKFDLITEIINYYKNTDLLKVQKQNRIIWEKYFSPVGFCKNLVEEFI